MHAYFEMHEAAGIWSGVDLSCNRTGYDEEEYNVIQVVFSNQEDVNVVTLFLIGKDVLIFICIQIQEMQLEDQRIRVKHVVCGFAV